MDVLGFAFLTVLMVSMDVKQPLKKRRSSIQQVGCRKRAESGVDTRADSGVDTHGRYDGFCERRRRGTGAVGGWGVGVTKTKSATG